MTDPTGDRSALWWAWATVRTAGCWALLSLLTLVCTALYLPAAPFSPEGAFVRGIERFWVWFILRGSNVKLSVDGAEQVRKGSSYIVMANHRSMYDIPALHYLLGRDRDLRWVGKNELTRVPVFGWAFGASRHIAIDRQNRARAVEALERAAEESAAGVSFVVMPEGTRSRDRRLLPFKKGGFHLAIDTGLPILPVGISGSERLMPKGTWWILPGAIHVSIRPPVSVAGWSKDHLDELIERVRAEVRSALPDLPTDTERSAR
ncbi:MAG TPA: lysophospholipid acyltransferase family protein [Gemmatimonadota bacterium]|nr:lysophospholipid acyltransferase family protein [Gemmatimonadota bacterium]